MLSRVLSIFAVLAFLLGSALADPQAIQAQRQAVSDASCPAVVAYPAPAEEKLSEDFDLKVNGQRAPVYKCRVSAMPFNQAWRGDQRPLDQTELASFAYWDMAGPVEVEVVSHLPVESVAIRPTSRGIQAKIEQNRITFTMSSPQQITVEVNGWHKALHLFANGPQTATPDPKDPAVRYFGPGVHRPGKITLESNQTLYLAGGAVVFGAVEADGASNIHILGRGILDTSKFVDRNPADGLVGACIRLVNCHNVVIDGIVARDPNIWCISTYACSKVNISNVKLIGLWRYNADGIDICNSQDVTVRGCFVRSFDDSLVIKGLRSSSFENQSVQRVLFEGCVVWNDWGRALEVGAETAAPEMTDLVFRDCDIIRTSIIAMDIQHSDRATIKNVLFEKIRLEIDDVNWQYQFQKARSHKFAPDTNFCPSLLVVEIRKTMWGQDAERGTVENVTCRDCSVTGKHFPKSLLHGFDEQHQVKGVTIENLRINGDVITSLKAAQVKVDPFVQDVRILAP